MSTFSNKNEKESNYLWSKWLPSVAFVLSGTWGIIAVTGSWKDGKIPVGKSLDKCSEELRDPSPFLSPHSLKKKPQRFMFMKSFFCLFVFAFKYLKKNTINNSSVKSVIILHRSARFMIGILLNGIQQKGILSLIWVKMCI